MVNELETRLGDLLRSKKLTLSAAESCTGGLVGHRLTNIPGSSDYFMGSAVVYSNEAKNRLLGVQLDTLDKFGAVSRETVIEMARGVREAYQTDIGLSISGIAGPGGGTELKPVGLVWIGMKTPLFENAWDFNFSGGRLHIKEQAAEKSINLLIERLDRDGRQQPGSAPETGRIINDIESDRESIEVKADFDISGNIAPREFTYKGTKYPVDSIGRTWEDKNGHHYLVMVPFERIFELLLDTQETRWYLQDPNRRFTSI